MYRERHRPHAVPVLPVGIHAPCRAYNRRTCRAVPCHAVQAGVAREDLWQEAALLRRLLYKNANQHRSSHHLQVGFRIHFLGLKDFYG